MGANSSYRLYRAQRWLLELRACTFLSREIRFRGLVRIFAGAYSSHITGVICRLRALQSIHSRNERLWNGCCGIRADVAEPLANVRILTNFGNCG
jgi:hypothetical protein